MRLLAFDAHNHIHMGPSPPSYALLPTLSLDNETKRIEGNDFLRSSDIDPVAQLSGIAIMSTHPKDFSLVTSLTRSLVESFKGVHIVPCYGVHPWFLHELEEWHRNLSPSSNNPRWLHEIEQLIKQNPNAVVGEVGLDGFHFNSESGELSSPMEKQVEAFEAQMELAARYSRPVSIHAVKSIGPMLTSLSKLKKSKIGLPPKIYFHAFGGKVGTVDQLLALCGKEVGRTYFGFAPVVNFRSPKTVQVIKKVGINRIVLETDHEDAALVLTSMEEGISVISEALELSREMVVEVTTQNAFNLYGISS